VSTCRRCGSEDIEEGGPITNPEIPEDSPFVAEGKAYRSARNHDDIADWRYFRSRMDEVDTLFPNATVKERKDKKLAIYHDCWLDAPTPSNPLGGFHFQKYGLGGRKCDKSEYPDCKMLGYDPANYPWRREIVADQWWQANKPAWWPAV